MPTPSANYTASGTQFTIPIDETEQTNPTDFIIKANQALESHDHSSTRGLAVTRVGVLASPHFTGPIVDSGGLTITAGGETITAGGLFVAAGNIGIGASVSPTVGLQLSGSITSGSTSQAGIASQVTFPTTATVAGDAVLAQAITVASAFTMTAATDFHALNISRGAGSTITSAYGLLVDLITAGGTANYGIQVTCPTGASANNFGIYVTGTPSGGSNNAGIYMDGGTNLIIAGTFATNIGIKLNGSSFLYAGTGVPSNAIGNNGDFYFRNDGGAGTAIYQRRGGTWAATAA